MCLFVYNSLNFDKSSKDLRPVPVAARSEALVYGRYLAGTTGTNSGGWEVWMSVVSVVSCQVEVSATG